MALNFTQTGSEVWVVNAGPVRFTQSGLEVWLRYPGAVRATQTGTEVWSTNITSFRITQIGFEVWRSVSNYVPPSYLPAPRKSSASRFRRKSSSVWIANAERRRREVAPLIIVPPPPPRRRPPFWEVRRLRPWKPKMSRRRGVSGAFSNVIPPTKKLTIQHAIFFKQKKVIHRAFRRGEKPSSAPLPPILVPPPRRLSSQHSIFFKQHKTLHRAFQHPRKPARVHGTHSLRRNNVVKIETFFKRKPAERFFYDRQRLAYPQNAAAFIVSAITKAERFQRSFKKKRSYQFFRHHLATGLPDVIAPDEPHYKNDQRFNIFFKKKKQHHSFRIKRRLITAVRTDTTFVCVMT